MRTTVDNNLQTNNNLEDNDDRLIVRPLGAGQEVGRSCIYLEFKEKRILLDCGIHPGHSGTEALPYFDIIDPSSIDILLITHFHLDHCGAVPWFLENTNFRGKIYMTHATKGIYRWILADYIKVNQYQTKKKLFDEEMLEKSMDRIEAINFHQKIEINGIKFTSYCAGHVLGAAMFQIEIAGVTVLYTGDYCCEEDRHLIPAELPQIVPDVLIIEATYSTQIHEERTSRESRFCGKICEILNRGGRCLIPIFALGRAQELMLIIDEFWAANPEMQAFPILYASALSNKCLSVFKAYTGSMNKNIQDRLAFSSPFDFKFIKNSPQIENMSSIGPSVILATPGMMQSGISRDLFESWCSDPVNGTIIAGYSCEGTLAKTILSEPSEITSLSGQQLKLRCSVDYISFSAHADYKQTSGFIRSLKAPNIIFVHGEKLGMSRLREAINKQYANNKEYRPQLFEPMNTQAVELFFHPPIVAKVVGKASENAIKNGYIDGIVVKDNFNYTIIDPNEMEHFFDIPLSSIRQRIAIPFEDDFESLKQLVSTFDEKFSESNESGIPVLTVHNGVLKFSHYKDKKICTMEWGSGKEMDALADTCITALASSSIASYNYKPNFPEKNLKKKNDRYVNTLNTWLENTFGENKIESLGECGENVYEFQNDSIQAKICLNSNDVCCENESVKSLIAYGLTKLDQFFK